MDPTAVEGAGASLEYLNEYRPTAESAAAQQLTYPSTTPRAGSGVCEHIWNLGKSVARARRIS